MKVQFKNYNQMDNMYLDVDVMSQDVIFSEIKEDAEGYFYVRIYDDGFADYGYTQYCDPLHGNQEYTWSSRPEVINQVFNLYNTPLQLATYSIGVRDDGRCYIARGITFERACKIAMEHQELLQHGYMEFFINNKI